MRLVAVNSGVQRISIMLKYRILHACDTGVYVRERNRA
jgi:hypothetical protein